MLDVSQKYSFWNYSPIGWIFGYKNKSSIWGIQSFNDDDSTGKSLVFKINLLMDFGRIEDTFFAHERYGTKLGDCIKSN